MIRDLLDKYFEGETSLQEEAQLRQAFQQEELPADLLPYRPLFCYFQAAQSPKLGADFDERLLDQLSAKPEPTARVRRMPLRQWAARAAAIAAIAFMAWWMYLPAEQSQEIAATDWSKYEVQDPAEAFRITKSALITASTELNQGTKKATDDLSSSFKKIGKSLD